MDNTTFLEETGSLQNLASMGTLEGFPIRPGFYNYNGATALTGGVNFTVHSHGATSCELLLYKRTAKEPYATLKFPEHYRIGDVYSMIVFGLDIHEFEYAFRLDGPYNPREGLIFDHSKILLDPYAKAVTGQSKWGVKPVETPEYRARVVLNNFDWGDSSQPLLPMEDLVIYELHVRGFTKHASSGVANPGTFDGIREKIPYLKDLGINAIELMPIFEFDEMQGARVENGKQLLDFWGYNTVSFFAPNTSYSASLEYNREGLELKTLIRELHENGIEVILDVVFNHTAEGNEDGPYISFKGFDNNVYYLLTPDGFYYNFSGCGNTLNCNHPVVQQLILECLRHWVTVYRVDGFRFDLATILGRNEDGSPMQKPPLLQALAFDPILADTKLIAEAWDAGGLYQVGTFPSWKRWAEWNGMYRDELRQFLKGAHWMAPAATRRITGSVDLYDPVKRGDNASINFLTCHDGFTLYDLYSYNEKHNEANGWNNTDGSNDNHSWNCGEEGETDDPDILALRFQMIRNACAVLLCSRGTPMFYSGDEFCDTRHGNNNPYCQDNEISWLDWSRREAYDNIWKFFQYMIHFRLKHGAIRGSLADCPCGLPSVSLHGRKPWKSSFNEDSKIICAMFAGYDKTIDANDIVYIALNVFWEAIEITLPDFPSATVWKLAVHTANLEGPYFYEEDTMPEHHGTFLLPPRSVCVFVM